MAPASAHVWPLDRQATVNRMQRRQSPRHNAIGQVARVDGLGVVGRARVGNVSNGGAMIRISAPMEPGSPVRLSFDCTNSLQGRVVWCSGGRTGIRFLSPIDCGRFIGKITSDRFDAIVRAPRLPASISARVKGPSGEFAAVVSNLSEKGMRISSESNLCVGSPVEIILAAGTRMRGTVRWSDSNFAGVELAGKIDVADLMGPL